MSEHKINPNARPDRPHCATCPHYFSDNPSAGHCRRYPPTFAPLWMTPKTALPGVAVEPQLAGRSSWPPVGPDKYCGEHPEFIRWWMRSGAIGVVAEEPAQVQ